MPEPEQYAGGGQIAPPSPPVHPPNTIALKILSLVRGRQKGRSPSPSTRTEEYVRQARSGEMYDYGVVDR
jgi:hypothetical protein